MNYVDNFQLASEKTEEPEYLYSTVEEMILEHREPVSRNRILSFSGINRMEVSLQQLLALDNKCEDKSKYRVLHPSTPMETIAGILENDMLLCIARPGKWPAGEDMDLGWRKYHPVRMAKPDVVSGSTSHVEVYAVDDIARRNRITTVSINNLMHFVSAGYITIMVEKCDPYKFALYDLHRVLVEQLGEDAATALMVDSFSDTERVDAALKSVGADYISIALLRDIYKQIIDRMSTNAPVFSDSIIGIGNVHCLDDIIRNGVMLDAIDTDMFKGDEPGLPIWQVYKKDSSALHDYIRAYLITGRESDRDEDGLQDLEDLKSQVSEGYVILFDRSTADLKDRHPQYCSNTKALFGSRFDYSLAVFNHDLAMDYMDLIDREHDTVARDLITGRFKRGDIVMHHDQSCYSGPGPMIFYRYLNNDDIVTRATVENIDGVKHRHPDNALIIVVREDPPGTPYFVLSSVRSEHLTHHPMSP